LDFSAILRAVSACTTGGTLTAGAHRSRL